MASRIAALMLLVGCGPSTGDDQPCGLEDLEAHGTLVGLDARECSPCPRETSFIQVMFETACEAGVEWRSPSCLIDQTHATNVVTDVQFSFDLDACQLDDRLWSVTPDEPLVHNGRRLDDFIEEPGDYAFLVEMRFDLPSAEFEGRVD